MPTSETGSMNDRPLLLCQSRSCLNSFTPVRDWQVYCSDECSARERYERWKLRDLERRGAKVKEAIERLKVLRERREKRAVGKVAKVGKAGKGMTGKRGGR